MKKIFTIFMIVALTFMTGCEKSVEPVNAKIIVPFGGPAITHIQMIKEEPELLEGSQYSIEVVRGADPLVAAFTSKSHDIIIAPTNLGAKMYNANSEYVLAATIAWGANYLVSTEGDFNLEDLRGQEIIAFGKNATPDVVLTSVLKKAGIYDEVTIKYVNSVNDVQAEIIAGNAKFGLLAEPILTVTKTKKQGLGVLDLQEEWASISGKSIIPQAGVFVSKSLLENNKDFVTNYLAQLEKSIDFANTSEDLASYSDEIEFGLPGAIVAKATPSSNLKFVNAIDSKDDLLVYFNEIMELNPKLIGDKLPDADFYLK